MSRLLGSELPSDLVLSLGTGPGPKFEEVIAMVSIDEHSLPHIAMLSRWEVFAADKENLRIATYTDSTTTRNLLRNGATTFIFVNEQMSYYVKGTAALLKERASSDPSNSLFNVRVVQVYEDKLEGAKILSGMRFEKVSAVEPHESLFLELAGS